MRAGAHALTLLSVPLNVEVLTALEESPMALVDLRRALGSPPQTTTRNQLRTLTDLGLLERRQQPEFPGSVDYGLERAGRELLKVARVTDSWLGAAPDSPIDLGTSAAKNSIKALVDGWTSAVVRALASGPLSLTQLSRLISTLNYPSLERRLAAMRLTGQIAADEKQAGRFRPYSATPWLRRAVGPLAAAVAWERRFAVGDAAPLTPIDVESAFLLALPLIRLSHSLSGSARMVVELRSPDGKQIQAGVIAGVAEGAIVSCVARLERRADAWSSGPVGAWLSAAISGEFGGLEVGGDCRLAVALMEGLNTAFHRVAQPA
jgi:DNA-binding HxlR family transcriptional regulator